MHGVGGNALGGMDGAGIARDRSTRGRSRRAASDGEPAAVMSDFQVAVSGRFR